MEEKQWYSEYEIRMVSGPNIKIDYDAYMKIYRRITGLKKLDKPFELQDGGLLFVNKIVSVQKTEDAMTLEDYRDQELVELEEEAEMTAVMNDVPDEPEVTIDEIPTGAPDEEGCNHDDLPIGMVTQTNGVKRYFPFCPDCGHRGRMIRHADVPTDGIIVDLNENK